MPKAAGSDTKRRMRHLNDPSNIVSALLSLCDPKGRVFAAPPPGVQVYQRMSAHALEAQVYDPLLCIVLRGSKRLNAGAREIHLQAGDAMVVNQHIPATYQITQASEDAPFLAIALTLNLSMVRDHVSLLDDPPTDDKPSPAMVSGPGDPMWLEPLIRYLQLAEVPRDLKVLGPATLSEVHYRLLMSSAGRQLHDLLSANSHASRIARAIGHIREGFRTRLSVQDLAAQVGMSASSFHSHFKTVTGTTPLQFQKSIRLIAAQELLVDTSVSVSAAAYAVGYESPAHFSRDFRRTFGHAPSERSGPR